QPARRVPVQINDDGDRALRRRLACNRAANALGPSGHHHYFPVKLQVHARIPLAHKIESHFRQRFPACAAEPCDLRSLPSRFSPLRNFPLAGTPASPNRTSAGPDRTPRKPYPERVQNPTATIDTSPPRSPTRKVCSTRCCSPLACKCAPTIASTSAFSRPA